MTPIHDTEPTVLQRSPWLEDNRRHSVKADPKPPKRIRDVVALRRFHDHHKVCLCCYDASVRVHAHHLIRRSQGGDDNAANLIPLCAQCHGAVHGQSYVLEGVRITKRDVEETIAEFLRDERGEDHCAYLIKKLGAFGAEHFVQKLEQS